MLGITLALSSSLCGGCADFFGGMQTRRLPLLTVLLVSQVFALALAAGTVIAIGQPPPVTAPLLSAALAGAAIALALGCLYQALAIGAMMVTAPIASTGAIGPVLVGYVRGEQVGVTRSIGITVALIGVVLAARERPTRGEAHHSELGRTAIGLALLSACAFGAFFVLINSAASSGTAEWAVLTSRASFVAVLSLAMLTTRRRIKLEVCDIWPLLAVGILDFGAVSLFAFASRNGLLSIVSVLASFPPLVTVVLARLVLDERIRRDQTAGVALTLLGVSLIAAG